MNGYSTGRSDPSENRERGDGLTGEPSKRSIRAREDCLADMESRPAAATCPDDDREQLRRAQGLRAEVLEPLTRTLRPRQLSNT